jgi:hypothetical protein
MKPIRIVCLILLLQCSLQAQTATEEKFISANAEASATVSDNSILYFYTIDELNLGTVTVPLNTRFSATVNLYKGRAFLKVSSIKVRDEIHTVDWRIMGPDHKEGLPFIETEKSIEVYEDQRFSFKVFSNGE